MLSPGALLQAVLAAALCVIGCSGGAAETSRQTAAEAEPVKDGGKGLKGGYGLGTGKARSDEEDLLSEIIKRIKRGL